MWVLAIFGSRTETFSGAGTAAAAAAGSSAIWRTVWAGTGGAGSEWVRSPVEAYGRPAVGSVL